MTVAAYQCRARQGEALFRPHDMDDALFHIGVADQADTEFGGIAFQRGELLRTFRVGDRDAIAIGVATRRGGQIMIRHGQRQVRPPHRSPSQAKPLKRLWRRHLMHEVAINIDQAGAIRAALDDMRVPDLLIEGAELNHSGSPPRPGKIGGKGGSGQ